MTCDERRARGSVRIKLVFVKNNKNYGNQLDRDMWSHSIILTYLADHQCLGINTIWDFTNVRLFLVKQFVKLVKED